MIIDNMNIVIDKTDPYYEDAKKYFYKVVDEEIRPLYRIDEDEEVLIINRGLKFLLPKSMLNDVEDYTTNDIDIDVKQDPEFYRNILDGITLRDDQILAVMKCLTHKRGICQLPTGCFVADTPVMTLLGKSKSIKSLVDDYNNGIKNYVYSCTEDGTIVPGEVISGQLTKYVNKLYELTLDNGEVIRCTPDHPFMLRDGSYKHAEDLLMTDSLMPITVYRKDVDTISDELYYTGHPHLHERLFIKHPNSNGLQLVHTMVTRNYYPDVAYESGKSVHHIDHNPDNNYPENLLVMNTLDHDELHLSEGRNTRWNGPNNEYYRELERQRLSNRNKNNWKNNDYRKRMSKIISKNSKNSKMVNELNYNSDFQFSTRKGKVLSYINYMITKFGKDNITIDNFEELSYSLTEYRQHVRLDGIAKVYDCSTPHPKGRRYNGINYNKLRELWDLILDEASLYNHKIIKVEVVELEEPIPVYDIEVKDYHNFAVGSNKSGVFVHNCGKTIIIAAIIKYYGMMLGYYPTTLIFEPTNYLVNEMIERFNSYGIPATKYSDHRQSIEGVTISHPMSLYNDLQKDDELFSEVKIFIGDEIHHQSCNTWSTIYNSLNSIEVSLGFSASIIDQSKIPVVRLSDLTYEEAVIFGCTGNIIMNLPTSYFIKIGVLATPVLFRMSNAASEWVYDDRNWHQLMQKKLESNTRTKIVCDCTTLFNILDFKTLIIVSTKRYAEKIIRKLDEYHIKDKCVLSYGSGVYLKLNDNNELVDCRDEDPKSKFSSGELNIMIATTHLLEGVDVPNLDVVILPQIGKKDRRIIQGIGRALRKTKHGHYAYIIDFDDYMSGVLKYQSDTRMKMYKEVIGIKECDIYDHFSLSSMKQVVKRLENI